MLEDNDICWYCGELATTKDHIRPRCQTANGLASITVPACRDCNCASLKSAPLFSDIERGKYIVKKLRKRLAKCNRVKWTDEQLAEVSPKLRIVCIQAEQKYNILERRLGYAIKVWGKG